MSILEYNVSWMIWNVWLGILPILFINLALYSKQKVLRIPLLLLWFLFVPNTIYIVTDLMHISEQWSLVGNLDKIILCIQYILLEICGLALFFLALSPFEQLLRHSRFKKQVVPLLVLLNFLIGFAIDLGRIERVNSWYIFTKPEFFFTALLHATIDPAQIGLVFLFGLLANAIYFLYRLIRNYVSNNLWTPYLSSLICRWKNFMWGNLQKAIITDRVEINPND